MKKRKNIDNSIDTRKVHVLSNQIMPVNFALFLYRAIKNFVVYFRATCLIKPARNDKPLEGIHMKWETPAYNDMRFGFEVTMYIYNR